MTTMRRSVFFSTKLSWTVTLAAAALGIYLLSTHTGHVIYALPYLILLACPLIHFFMHGHGHHNHDENSEKSK